MDAQVIIAGGGIGGLTLALTLHQIGVSCIVLESAKEMRPLGVGINVQPNAVRELFDLGLSSDDLDRVGVPAKEWALLGLNGKEIYAEPRGTYAGYKWPQYAAHRGAFQMLLYQKVVERLGAQAVQLGTRVTGYENLGESVEVHAEHADGERKFSGALLIGADGIHSKIRAQMHPSQPPIHWGGALLWRGTSRIKPLRSGSSFVGLGTHKKRMVIYPISAPDADGLVLTNWIAEVVVENSGDWTQDSWFTPVPVSKFIHQFESFKFDWLDVPEMLKQSDSAFENPMIDRDPIPTWIDGCVGLIGDAAHPMYPTGSNGASQAIVDARVLASKFLQHGLSATALRAFDTQLCGPISELVLRNRGAGPFGMLNTLDERCGGVFDDIETVFPAKERLAFMKSYKSAAGFALETLNAAPPTIPTSAKLTT
ncbi:flavin-dependent oxidoreductase [Planktotalea sp.]|uniref:flavin-dependent oxidoreductase n=1 Tax=Planktotalea sp. TaxID=2029877 RepID=UPI003D6AA845